MMKKQEFYPNRPPNLTPAVEPPFRILTSNTTKRIGLIGTPRGVWRVEEEFQQAAPAKNELSDPNFGSALTLED